MLDLVVCTPFSSPLADCAQVQLLENAAAVKHVDTVADASINLDRYKVMPNQIPAAR